MNDSSKHKEPALKPAVKPVVNTLTVAWNSSVSSIDSDTLICSENRHCPLVHHPGDPRIVLKIPWQLLSFYVVYFFHSHHVMYEVAWCLTFYSQTKSRVPPKIGPCGFRPFDFDSKLKIENQKFTIVIFNIWFLKNWKSQI